MFGNSATYYDTSRRARVRRTWSVDGHGGMQGYAAYLMGAEPTSAETTAIVGADVAAFDTIAGDGPWRAIGIGVATGVLTFVLNRWLGKVLG